MIMGMTDRAATLFLERISATAIVNQAVMKCQLADIEVNHDNVIRFVGDFVDPTLPEHAGLISQIQRELEDVILTVNSVKDGRRRLS